MFRALPAGTLVEASPDQLVGVMRSINTPLVSFGGGRKTPSRAYILGVGHRDQVRSLYIALTPQQGTAAYLFCTEPERLDAARYPEAEHLALELVKRYGFQMERLEFAALPQEQRNLLLQEMPLRWTDVDDFVGELASLLAISADESSPLADALDEVLAAQSKERFLTEEMPAPPMPPEPEEDVILLDTPSMASGMPPAAPPSLAPLDSASQSGRISLDPEDIAALLGLESMDQEGPSHLLGPLADLLALF
jgi:hypothetical protein